MLQVIFTDDELMGVLARSPDLHIRLDVRVIVESVDGRVPVDPAELAEGNFSREAETMDVAVVDVSTVPVSLHLSTALIHEGTDVAGDFALDVREVGYP